jgi:uncharacterized membrane protein YoaK (UPF0700 family)
MAAGLSAVAGFVDAVGFIHLGGYFVSFMSGNSTRAGAVLAAGSWLGFGLAMGLVAAFLAGVITASLLRRMVPRRKRLAVLFYIAALLCAAALMFDGSLWLPLVPPLMAFAMGAENVVFERDGEVSIGLTYMTGTLVKMGQRIATAVAGGDKLGWVRYFGLWAALTSGSVLGGFAYHALNLDALWLSVLGVLAAILWSRRIPALRN